MTVKGQIFALSQFPDSFLARLRLRVLEGNRQPPNIGITPTMTGRVLAEVRLDDLGQFGVCVERVPFIFLEVLATDELTCQTPWAAETVFEPYDEGTKPKRYFAYSPVFPTLGVDCGWGVDVGQQYVDLWGAGMTVERARAFFPATMIALEMRDFMEAHAGEHIATDPPYRARFVYTWPSDAMFNLPLECREEQPNGSQKPARICFRPIPTSPGWIYVNDDYSEIVENMDVVDHEYGHDAHYAKGGFNYQDPAPTMLEGIAEFIRGVKEELDGRYRGGHYLAGYGSLEAARDDQTWRLSAGWLYDIWDQHVDFLDPGPCPDWSVFWKDLTSTTFIRMWNTFDVQYNGAEARKHWTENWVNLNQLRRNDQPWWDFKVLTFAHMIYKCNEEDTFPAYGEP